MIVPEVGKEKAGATVHEEAPGLEQPPPPYSAPDATGGPAPQQPSSSTSSTPAPTNHVSVSKTHGEVVGSWAIDPRIQVPATLLSPLAEGESENSRNNFYIKSHNGALSLDVALLPSEGVGSTSGRTAALLEAHTIHGAVKFNLLDAPGQEGLVRLPVKVTLSSHNGAVYVRIPRSFRGVINVKYSWGSVKLSEGVTKQVRHSTEGDSMRRLFIGEFDESDFSHATWAGDEINAQTKRGNVCFSYVDEAEIEGEVETSQGKGLFSRLTSGIRGGLRVGFARDGLRGGSGRGEFRGGFRGRGWGEPRGGARSAARREVRGEARGEARRDVRREAREVVLSRITGQTARGS